MRMVLIGVTMMSVGFATLFGMVIGAIAPDLFLSLAAYGLSFCGMLLGTFAVAQRVRR
jgi:hypothetical protein